MAKTKRLEIRADESFIEKLEYLAKASKTSKADIIDRAIVLYANALEEAERGNTITFVPAREDSPRVAQPLSV